MKSLLIRRVGRIITWRLVAAFRPKFSQRHSQLEDFCEWTYLVIVTPLTLSKSLGFLDDRMSGLTAIEADADLGLEVARISESDEVKLPRKACLYKEHGSYISNLRKVGIF